jgi:hypothetical protein
MDIMETNPAPQVCTGFHVTFESTSALRTLLDVLSSIFTRGVEFKVCRKAGGGPEDGQLKIEAIDSSHVCIVRAAIECKVVRLERDYCFTIDTSTMNACIKSVHAHYAMDIFTHENSSDVTLKLYEALSKTHVCNFRINTLVNSGLVVPDIKELFFTYILEFDATCLRSCVRNCKETHASDVAFKIAMPPKHVRAQTDGNTHLVVSVSAQGTTVFQERVFHSIVDTRRGTSASSLMIVTDHDEDVPVSESDIQEHYSGRFSIHYLALFLKSIERHTVTMRLEKNQPLVLSYPLGGGEDSYIVLVLAPKIEE